LVTHTDTYSTLLKTASLSARLILCGILAVLLLLLVPENLTAESGIGTGAGGGGT